MKKVQSKNTAVRNAKRKRKLKQRNKKAMSIKSHTFFKWEKFTEMHAEVAKNLYVNGKTVQRMLKEESVAENLKKSPGAARLVSSFTELTSNLVTRLNSIKALHDGKSGDVDMDNPNEMDAVMDIYEKYTEMSEVVMNEYAQCLASLDALKNEPNAFLTDDEAERLSKVAEKFESQTEVAETTEVEVTGVENE